jgi:amino acid transporter
LTAPFAVPDVNGTVSAGAFDVQYIWQTATSAKWAEFMLVIACTAQLFCGAASVTSASRMLLAFSRDGAVPGHGLWRRLALKRTPVFAVMAICALSWALMLPTLSNAAVGYLVGTSIAVIGLYLAFVLPIILRNRLGDRFAPGEWSLGKHHRCLDRSRSAGSR